MQEILAKCLLNEWSDRLPAYLQPAHYAGILFLSGSDSTFVCLTCGPGQTFGQSPRPNPFQPLVPCSIKVSKTTSPDESQTKAVPHSNEMFHKSHQLFSTRW